MGRVIYLHLPLVPNASVPLRIISYPLNRPLSYSELKYLVEMALVGEEDIILIAESFSGPIGIT